MKVKIVLREIDVDEEKRETAVMNDKMGLDIDKGERIVIDFNFRRELLENYYIEPTGEKDIKATIRGRVFTVLNTPNTIKKLNIELNGDV